MGLHKLLQAAACISFAAACHASCGPRVVLPQGTVAGYRDANHSAVYLGIPYAQTTGGENR